MKLEWKRVNEWGSSHWNDNWLRRGIRLTKECIQWVNCDEGYKRRRKWRWRWIDQWRVMTTGRWREYFGHLHLDYAFIFCKHGKFYLRHHSWIFILEWCRKGSFMFVGSVFVESSIHWRSRRNDIEKKHSDFSMNLRFWFCTIATCSLW